MWETFGICFCVRKLCWFHMATSITAPITSSQKVETVKPTPKNDSKRCNIKSCKRLLKWSTSLILPNTKSLSAGKEASACLTSEVASRPKQTSLDAAEWIFTAWNSDTETHQETHQNSKAQEVQVAQPFSMWSHRPDKRFVKPTWMISAHIGPQTQPVESAMRPLPPTLPRTTHASAKWSWYP